MDEAVEFATDSPNPSIDAFQAEIAAAEAPFVH